MLFVLIVKTNEAVVVYSRKDNNDFIDGHVLRKLFVEIKYLFEKFKGRLSHAQIYW